MNAMLLVTIAASLNTAMILPSAPARHVVVREPMMRLVRPSEIHVHCGKGANVEACTAFVGQRLECVCTSTEDRWRIESRARFIPVMYLTGPVWVSHEREHVEDVRRRVEAHLQTIALHRFGSLDQCRKVAERERDQFSEVMDRFKLESNVSLHPRTARAALRHAD